MLLESTTFWLIVFYAFVALAIGFVLLMYGIVNRSRFRFEDGEGIGVGYEEDSVGHIVHGDPGTDLAGPEPVHAPHMTVPTVTKV